MNTPPPLTQSSPGSSPLVSRREAAAYLGLAPQTLAQWACSGRGRLPMVKVGRKVQYKKTDLDAFIVANTQCTRA
ncbi:helix-turn-helix domain-containing protein [Massilia brevitalea]|uniref:helix-turn-helix domain-containing protein n=1 Tax=Massilia brevitalea TaxID=442526 RepID=UPI00273A40CC|nr:helix-turn-helix domain-containing protein [Massilia brevitalea]